MHLNFRQGIVSYQLPAFLTVTPGFVSLLVTNTQTLVTFAHGANDYLLTEKVSVSNAWTIVPLLTQYMYWDINTVTGLRTFGVTTFTPVVSGVAPVAPVADQHWFDTSTTTMKVWSGTAWTVKIRVFACKLVNGGGLPLSVSINAPAFDGTQVGITNVSVNSGAILFDQDNIRPLRLVDGTFLTTETALLLGSGASAAVKVAGVTIPATAEESLPAFTVVKFSDFGKIVHADQFTAETIPFGMIQVASVLGQDTLVTISGVVTNLLWNWAAINVFVYSDANGVVVDSPTTSSAIPIGVVVDVHSILLGAPQVFLQDSADYATTTSAGDVRLSSAPTSASVPIAVGTNGGTMTGLLILSGDPVVALGAATKQYVDNAIISETTNELHISDIGPGGTHLLQAWDADLDAVAALAGTGLAVRSALNTWVQRTIVGTASNIVVTNGDGVAGNPILNLAGVVQGVGGSFLKFTLDGFGRVTANTPVVTADITALVDTTYVNVTGDTMTGTLTMMGAGVQITLPNAPVLGTDATNKTYVDAAVASETDSLSSLTVAVANNTINNAAWAQVWNWQLAADTTAFKFGENVASFGGAGLQYLLQVATLAGSTANPFCVTAQGNATPNIRVTATGQVDIKGNSIGTTGSNVNITAGNSPSDFGGAVVITAGQGNGGGNNGGAVQIFSGPGNDGVGGPIILNAGGGLTVGGLVQIVAGTSVTGGNIQLAAGSGSTGAGGQIDILAGPGATGGNVVVTGGNSSNDNGGNVDLIAGNYTGGGFADGGEIILRAGDTVQGTGGPVNITSGNSSIGAGGQVNITGGNGATSDGGRVVIKAGDSAATIGADVQVVGGNGVTNGGTIQLLGGFGSGGPGGDIAILAGVGTPTPGDVYIKTGNANTERIRIKGTGELQLAGDPGTAGYSLTSNGGGTPPTWQATLKPSDIGSTVQAWSAVLDTVTAGTYVGSSSIVTLGTITTGTWNGTTIDIGYGGTGATTASGARTNLGVGTGDSPEFFAVNIGDPTDTTVSRFAAGDIAVEGNLVYRAGGTDVPVTDGGTGASTASGARTNLGAKAFLDSVVTDTVAAGNYNITTTDEVVLINNTFGAMATATLPVPVSGRRIVVKKIDATANAVRVTQNAAEFIDGVAFFDLPAQYDSVTVVSNGTDWFVI